MSVPSIVRVSIRRAKLWDQEQRKTLPSVGHILIDHTDLTGVTAQQLDEALKKKHSTLFSESKQEEYHRSFSRDAFLVFCSSQLVDGKPLEKRRK